MGPSTWGSVSGCRITVKPEQPCRQVWISEIRYNTSRTNLTNVSIGVFRCDTCSGRTKQALKWIRYSLLLVVLLSGCKVLEGKNTNATLEAGDRAFSTEAAALAGTAVVQRTEVSMTVNAAGTDIALVNSVNERLHATLAAGSTATVAIIQATVDPAVMGATDDSMNGNGDRTIIITGLSDSVYPTTGCVVDARTSFSGEVSQLYVTMQSYNVQAGTPLRAEWYYEGNLRVQQAWVVDLTAAERCLWFQIDRSDTTFSPGTWSVALYVGEQNILIGAPITFYITGEE
jgi:hypothetical protein